MKKDILVINCGSSSIKFALIDPVDKTTLLTGLAEKLGHEDAMITFKHDGKKHVEHLPHGDHAAAMEAIIGELTAMNVLNQVVAVGHRIVHGGEHFQGSTLIDDTVISAIADCCKLAPLHNPGHLQGIHGAMKTMHDLPHAVVFDTAFHQTMPERAYLYAIPMSLYREQGLRRYGFHGTSHRYVTQTAATRMGRNPEDCAFICAHLGNGASACATLGGKSVDTTMGLTPLEGLVMGTRCGDIDPSIFGFLASTLHMDIQTITDLLNKKSGLLGLSELSNDCRVLEQKAAEGHHGASIALEIFSYRLAKHIAGLMVPLGRLDALLFTGGIGENSAGVRRRVVRQLGFLGLKLDEDANRAAVGGESGTISAEGSIPVMVIPTNEELMIALDTARLVGIAC